MLVFARNFCLIPRAESSNFSAPSPQLSFKVLIETKPIRLLLLVSCFAIMMFPTSFEMHFRDGALGRHEVKDGYEQLIFKARLQLVCSLQVNGGHATA